MPRIVLASSSPYRRQLLARLHLPFEVFVPNIDETSLSSEIAEMTALRLAREKARAVASTAAPHSLVIGSDQVATLNGEQIGKPGSHEMALEQLKKMRGQRVVFHTALCLWDGRTSNEFEAAQLANVQTSVTFRSLSDTEIDAYLRIEKPYDCAGSAKIEGLGIAIIEKIESADPTALIGLPLVTLTSMLRNAGVPFFIS